MMKRTIRGHIVLVSAAVLLLFGGNVDLGGALYAEYTDCGFSEASMSVSGPGDLVGPGSLSSTSGDWTVKAITWDPYGAVYETASLQGGIATLTAYASVPELGPDQHIGTGSQIAEVIGDFYAPADSIISFEYVIPPNQQGVLPGSNTQNALWFDDQAVAASCDDQPHTYVIQESNAGEHEVELDVEAAAESAYLFPPATYSVTATLTDFGITTVPEPSTLILLGAGAISLLAALGDGDEFSCPGSEQRYQSTSAPLPQSGVA